MNRHRNATLVRALTVLAFLCWPGTAAQAGNPCASADEDSSDALRSRQGTAASRDDEGGIGGTGQQANEGGIGGTGQQAHEGGIGGTGIVGVVTGFASLCVGGLEVHYGPDTPVAGNVARTAGDLAVGQVVAVDAIGSPGGLRARTISILDAVVGPVTRTDASGSRLQVLGQDVRVSPEATGSLGQSAPRLAKLRAGDFVAISGQRLQSGVIIASRVEPAPIGTVSLQGPVRRGDAGEIFVAGVRVSASDDKIATVRHGAEVLVTGRLVEGIIHAERVENDPAMALAGRAARMVVEGYVGSRGVDDRISVGGTTIRLTSETKFATDQHLADISADKRVRVSGRRDAATGELIAERVELRHRIVGRNEGRPLPRSRPDNARGADAKAGDSPSDGRGKGGDPGSGHGPGNSGRDGPPDVMENTNRGDRSGRDDRPRGSDRVDRPDRGGRGRDH